MKKAILALSLLPAALHAQVNPIAPTGNFAGVPFGLVWKKESGESTDIHCRWFGTPGPALDLPPGNSSFPDFGLPALGTAFAAAVGRAVAALDINGMTSMNDLATIVFNATTGDFEMIPPGGGNDQWGVFTFSVDQNGVPPLTGPLAIQETLLNGAIGSEVVSYYFQSGGTPLAGGSFLEMSRLFLSNFPAGVSATTPQLAAIDLAMPNIVLSNGQPIPQEMSATQVIAFTLTKDYVENRLNSGAPPAQINGRDVHPTSIIAANWDGSQWTNLRILADYNDLDLNADDDVDAIGVGSVPASVFSLTNVRTSYLGFGFLLTSHARTGPSDNRPQLRVHAPNVDGQPGVTNAALRTGPGSNITVQEAAGIRPGMDIRAVCVGDPEAVSYGRVWGQTGVDPQTASVPLPIDSVMSTVMEPRAPGTSATTRAFHLFAAGRLEVDSLVGVALGTPVIDLGNPLVYNLGVWPAKAYTFSRMVIVPQTIDLHSVLIRVPFDPALPITRSQSNFIFTR